MGYELENQVFFFSPRAPLIGFAIYALRRLYLDTLMSRKNVQQKLVQKIRMLYKTYIRRKQNVRQFLYLAYG